MKLNNEDKNLISENQKIINHINKCLNELFNANQPIMCRLASKIMLSLLPHADLLNFMDYFHTLLSLLNYTPDISILAWKIILELKLSNEQFYQSYITIEDYRLLIKASNLWIHSIENSMILNENNQNSFILINIIVAKIIQKIDKNNDGNDRNGYDKLNEDISPISIIIQLEDLLFKTKFKYLEPYMSLIIKIIKQII
ncbi:hypothetical protein K502DRAFT_97709 [Neoconidiobolus thromboides FSU 785]|nr:hypothetical protein K502DRAFT_97709 [Neoconidiobolus thromboides FSU 785]